MGSLGFYLLKFQSRVFPWREVNYWNQRIANVYWFYGLMTVEPIFKRWLRGTTPEHLIEKINDILHINLQWFWDGERNALCPINSQSNNE